MRYVVGYSANARGHDAVNLAVSLARGRGASLDLVLVVPEVQQFGAAHAPKAGFETLLNEQAREWLDEALALVPADVPAKAHIRSGDSDAHALIEAAEELGADVLVIGATSNGLFKRFTIGSVASSLLHASTVPVALAPHGYHRTEALTRISCGLGTRAGAEELLDFAIGMAANRKVPLRVVSLLALDGGSSADAAESAREYAEKAVAAAAPLDPSGVLLTAKTDIAVAQGRSIEEAVDDLEW
ncbi:MAG TPA: universal stress protein, partial [Arthrobacter sp.]|nr:universal stress protein [Arthrobacter sp.]